MLAAIEVSHFGIDGGLDVQIKEQSKQECSGICHCIRAWSQKILPDSNDYFLVFS